MKFVIVDDDAFILQLMKLVLEEAGHTVKSFESSVQALREIPIERPDCLISDVMMPEMDGFELCREIRKRPDLASIKIIMCTSKSYEFDRSRAKELGADALLILTDVPQAYIAYGTPAQTALSRVTAGEMRAYAAQGHFKAGSMGPKVEACLRFVDAGGESVIASLTADSSHLGHRFRCKPITDSRQAISIGAKRSSL